MEGFCFTLEKVAGPFLMSVVSGVVGGLIVYKMLDKKFNQRIAIPEQLGRYLTTEKYWHLRDMNIYPDFVQS